MLNPANSAAVAADSAVVSAAVVVAAGPAMAVALLTTLYGSLIANVFAIPISKKLKCRSDEEVQEKELIAQGILSILNRESPRFLVERLNVQLSPAERIIDAS